MYRKKIGEHFNKCVFVEGEGPDFYDWLFEETNGKIVHPSYEPLQLEFDSEADYLMFMLRWT